MMASSSESLGNITSQQTCSLTYEKSVMDNGGKMMNVYGDQIELKQWEL